ncbi:MAG: 50S ribosomal protein L30 [Chitinispirillia bacterium]|jgi:large subunit ribosomal protein L30
MARKIRIKQVKSAIGRLENQKRTLKALGIRRMGHTVEHNDTPVIRGMINRVEHLVCIEEFAGE